MRATFTDHPGGDIFASVADVLVCPVNCVPGVMGAGLALAFAKRFPDIKALHRLVTRQGLLAPGVVYMAGSIALFPTKRHWQDASNIADIQAGLTSLAVDLPAKQWAARSIAIPALGCGLGGLRWADVRPLIVEALCSGSVKSGIRVDIRPEVSPDIVADCRNVPLPDCSQRWVMADPPYSADYAQNLYGTGMAYPKPGQILKEASRLIESGGRVGLLHFIVPVFRRPLKLLGVYGVTTGWGNAIRAFSLFEKVAD